MLLSLSKEKGDSVIRGISFHVEPDSSPTVMEYRFLTHLHFTRYGALHDSGHPIFTRAVITGVILTFEGNTFDTFNKVKMNIVA